MTPEQIAVIAAALLTLAFTYIPGLREWYAGKSAEVKQLVMLGLLVLTVVGIFGLACANLLVILFPDILVDCNVVSAAQLVWALILAIIANQGVFLISPKPASVKAAKAHAK